MFLQQMRVVIPLLYFVILDKVNMAQTGSLYSVSLGVEGMTCGSCVQSIEQRLSSLPGVVDIKVRNNCKDVCHLLGECFSFPEGFKQFYCVSCI